MNIPSPSPSPSSEHGPAKPRRSRSEAVDPAEVLYAHDGTIVTYRWIYADGIRYNIAELRDVTKTRSTAIAGFVSAIAAAALGLMAALVLAESDAAVALLAVAATIVALLMAPILGRSQPVHYTLYARYRNTEVELFTTRDQRQFGQVARAIQRAIEALPRKLP